MTRDRNHNSEPKTPNKSFQKLLTLLGLLVVILAFVGGVSTAVLFLNWKKIFSQEQSSVVSTEQPSVNPSPIQTVDPSLSPSPSVISSPSTPTSLPTPSLVSPSPLSETKIPNNNVVERQGLIFQLQSCKKSITDTTNQRIVCEFSITSQQENVNVRLFANSSQENRTRIVYDGKESNAVLVEFGSYSNKSNVDNNLTRNAALNASFTFDNVPLQVEKLDLLEIVLYLNSSYSRDYIKIDDFRDVPLSGS
jgi:cytoskeletal protein RodZ